MSRRASFARRGVRAKLVVDVLTDAPTRPLRTPHRLVILLVAVRGQVDLPTLAAGAGLSPQTVKRYVDELVSVEWIERHTYDGGAVVYRPARTIADLAAQLVAEAR